MHSVCAPRTPRPAHPHCNPRRAWTTSWSRSQQRCDISFWLPYHNCFPATPHPNPAVPSRLCLRLECCPLPPPTPSGPLLSHRDTSGHFSLSAPAPVHPTSQTLAPSCSTDVTKLLAASGKRCPLSLCTWLLPPRWKLVCYRRELLPFWRHGVLFLQSLLVICNSFVLWAILTPCELYKLS